MKKIMPVIFALAIFLQAMPVMAADRSIKEGGLTLDVPTGYTAYTQEEYAQASKDNLSPVLDVAGWLADWNDVERYVAGAIVGIGAEIDAEWVYEDPLELLICDDTGNRAFEIYSSNDGCFAWESLPYWSLRDTLLPAWTYPMTASGYSIDVNDAIACETTAGIPYIEIDGTDSNGCCRMAIFKYDGYSNSVLFTCKNEQSLSAESMSDFNDLINSFSISRSTPFEEKEGPVYGALLYDRIELND